MLAHPDNIYKIHHSMQSCVSDIKFWTPADMYKMNYKTELAFVTSKRTKHLHNLPTAITIGNAQITFKQSVKKFGLTLNYHLTINNHVSTIDEICYFDLRCMASIHDSRQIQQLTLSLLCQELMTVSHCSLILLQYDIPLETESKLCSLSYLQHSKIN